LQKKSSAALPAAPVEPQYGYLFPPIPPDEFEVLLSQQPDKVPPVPRVPPEVDGVQLNFCKTPTCSNYGIPPEPVSTKGTAARTNPNRYTIVASGKGLPMARCNACGESFSLKNNRGIVDERNRLRPVEVEPCCPHEDCSQHGLGVSIGSPFYAAFGKTTTGAPRWRCNACKKTFSSAVKSTSRQRATHLNKLIFKELVNKAPIRRIADICEVSAQTVYDKLDFIWKQCVAFAADRESKLSQLAIRRLYIGVDKQDYAINWTKREDKRNVVLSCAAFVDNKTNYALGTWLNFDPAADTEAIEKWAWDHSQLALPTPYRDYANLWTSVDYQASVKASAAKKPVKSLEDSIAQQYAATDKRRDIESIDEPTVDDQLPEKGMQVHTEYLLYGAFMRLAEMLGSVEKVRFFLDQDSGMRAACLGAWADRVKDRTCDAFYVSIAKDRTVDQKRRLSAESQAEIKETMSKLGCTRQEAILATLKDRIAKARKFGKWNDRWVFHPMATMSEPEKAVCHLTDYGDMDDDHLAWTYNLASLHGVDSYFNRIRRRVSLLERGMHSQGNAGRVWNGYQPYKPQQIQKLLDIFRVCHNYIWTRDIMEKAPINIETGEQPKEPVKVKKTPAMLLGLAKGVVAYEDVIYFKP